MGKTMIFPSKQAVVEHLRDAILSALEEPLRNSALRVGVYDSPKTNSKYVNLYYANREENPDPDRLPYTVRISDHDQMYLFRKNRPNAYLQVKPVFTASEQVQRNKSIQLYEYFSLRLQDCGIPPKARQDIVQLRQQCADMLTAHQKNLSYTYSGSLNKTINEMRELLIRTADGRSGWAAARQSHLQHG